MDHDDEDLYEENPDTEPSRYSVGCISVAKLHCVEKQEDRGRWIHFREVSYTYGGYRLQKNQQNFQWNHPWQVLR